MNNYTPDDPDLRSQSPEPIYDNEGKRINTREVRKRDTFIRERIALIEDCMKMRKTYSKYYLGSFLLKITSHSRNLKRYIYLKMLSKTQRQTILAKSLVLAGKLKNLLSIGQVAK